MRVTGVLGAAILLATFVSDGAGQSLTISANPGRTPGIVADAFSPQQDEGAAVSEVRVGGSGTAYFQATCCFDVTRGRQVNLDIVSPRVTALTALPRTGQWVFPLNINATGTGGRPRMPYGKYVAQISVTSQDGTQTASTEIGLTVLPDRKLFRSCHTRLNPAGHAPPSFFETTTHVAVGAQVRVIEVPKVPPPKPGDYDYAIAFWPRLTEPVAVRMEIRDTNLPEDSAEVVWVDGTKLKRGGVAVGCLPPSSARRGPVELLTSGTMPISKAFDRTLVIRMRECRKEFLGICWPGGKQDWVDVAIFADEGFWDAFGGKQIRFVWFDNG